MVSGKAKSRPAGFQLPLSISEPGAVAAIASAVVERGKRGSEPERIRTEKAL
jgi:hypothetical protein